MIVANGRVVNPSQGIDRILDVRVTGERIAELGERLTPETDETVVDASGAFVSPGFIDMHVHLREPGHAYKETIETGTAAAVAGGFTAVAAMPNTDPAADSPQTIAYVLGAAHRAAHCRVYPIAAVTAGRTGDVPVNFAALRDAGAVAFSDDGSTIADARVALACAELAAQIDALVIGHCEDARIKGDAPYTRTPAERAAEDAIVARDLAIAAATGCRWHAAHVSTKFSLELLRWARATQALAGRVSCEVTPHHLVFTAKDVERLGASGKVNPPLRYDEDVRALREGVRDGTVDAFASDHAPHTDEEKSGALEDACVGFTGLEIAAGAYAYALPDLPVTRFVELISVNPARLLNVPGGTLRPGSPADLTVFADRAWRVEPAAFHSKGRSTPFAGMTLPRRAIVTIVGGRIAMREGRIAAHV